MSVGRVAAVYIERLGTMVTETVVGDGVVTDIPVDAFVVDFAETGGQLQHAETGDIYAYTKADDEAETITLAAGLPIGKTLTEDDSLYVYPLATDYYADISVDDVAEPPVAARVPQEMREKVPEGTRTFGTGELIHLEPAGEGWEVTGLAGAEPVIDGSYIDPDTLPIPPLSDGIPPAVSPTPTIVGVPRLLIVQWPGITNADPVTYEVHVSITDGFTADATTLHHTTSATMTSVESLPDGTALEYDTTYFVRIVATDEDGAASAGDQASGQLDPNGTPDIAVGAITAATLESVLVLATRIVTAESGRRVEVSNEGILVIEQNDDILVNLTTDPTSPMTFNGEVVAQALIVTGGLSIRGGLGSIEKESTLTLESSIQSAQSQPSAFISWPIQTLDDDSVAPESKRGLFWNSADSTWFYCKEGPGAAFEVYQVDVNGAPIDVWDLDASGQPTVPVFEAGGGITKIGSTWYILGFDKGTNDWFVARYDSSFIYIGRWAYTANTGPGRPVIGNDGTNIIIARVVETGPDAGKIHIRAFNPVSGFQIGTTVVTGETFGVQTNLVGLHLITGGTGGFPLDRFVVAQRSAGAGQDVIHVYNTSGVQAAAEEWPIANEAVLCGLGFDGVDFHHLSEGSGGGPGHIVQYLTAHAWDDAESSKWWVSYTWYDSDVTGGTHETTQSPKRELTMKKRARLVVTTPPIPDLGGTDDPDSVRIYLGRGSTEPDNLGMIRQATLTPGDVTVRIDDAEFSAGVAAPSTNTFPGATPATLQTSGGGTYIKGDGRLRFGAGNVEFAAGIDGGLASDTTDANGRIIVPHGLGVVPFAAFAERRSNEWPFVFSRSSTDITIEFRQNANIGTALAGGAAVTCDWVVLG